MKNKIDRMKTPAMHLSKRTVALILSVIMLVSSIATGSMLNTFAAYIKDNAAKTDAIADAASEGSAIAESAIPSEDADAPAQADDADEKPDLSGFEESEIVRRFKNDLAAAGAGIDLAETGYSLSEIKYLKLTKSGGSEVSYDINSGNVSVNISSAGTYYFYVKMNNGDELSNTGSISNSISNWQLDTKTSTTNSCTLNVSTTGTYTFKFTISGDKVKMAVTFPSGGSSGSTTYVLTGDTAITGTSGWKNTTTNNTANQLTYNSETKLYTITKTVSNTSKSFNFRIVPNGTWDKTWGVDRANEVDNANIATWSTGSDNNINLTLSQAANIEIRFDDSKSDTSAITVIITPTTSTVTAAVTPTGSGTATVGGQSSATVAYGGTVTVSATPTDDYLFSKWTSTNGKVSFASTTNASTTATVTGTDTVTANFVKKSYTVSKGTGDGFTITTPTSNQSKQWGTSVSVAAKTSSDLYYIDYLYYLNNNTGDEVVISGGAAAGAGSATTLSGTFNMPKNNVTVYAHVHEKESNTITYGITSDSPSGSGYINVGKQHGSSTSQIEYTIDSGSKVLEGTKVLFGARAAAHYKFLGWYPNADGTGTQISPDKDYVKTSPSGNYFAKFAAETPATVDPRDPETGKIKVFIDTTKCSRYNTIRLNGGGHSNWESVTIPKTATYTMNGATCWKVEFTATGNVNAILTSKSNAWDDQSQDINNLAKDSIYYITAEDNNQYKAYWVEPSYTSTTAPADGETTTYYPLKLYVTNPELGYKNASGVSSTYTYEYFRKAEDATFVYARPNDTDNYKNRYHIVSGSNTKDKDEIYVSGTADTYYDYGTMKAAGEGAVATVTYIPKSYYKVNFSAGAGGTITATAGGTSIKSGTSVKEGTTVVYTAAASSGYDVAGWTKVKGQTFTNTSTTVKTISSLSEESEVRVYFSKSKGTSNTGTKFGYGTDNNPSTWTIINTYVDNGRVYAYIDGLSAATTYYFQAYQAKSSYSDEEKYTYQYYRNNDNSWADTNFNPDVYDINKYKRNNDYNASCNEIQFKVTSKVSGVKIDLGPVKSGTTGEADPYSEKNTYHIIPIYNTDVNKVTVYAKDGTFRDDSEYDYTPSIADTVITNPTGGGVTNISSHNEFETAVAEKSKKITVTTTIDSGAYNRDRFYVKGFSFNGVTPELLEPNDSGQYTCTYTIPADFEDDYLEITPIYFIKDSYLNTADNKTSAITFYIENYDEALQNTGWGNTLAVYPFYSTATSPVYSKANVFGGYPGLPVVNYGGRRFVQVPTTYKIAVDNESGSAYSQGTDATIKGITLSNYYWDKVHRDYCREVDTHLQTYDYDDFYTIYKETSDGYEANGKSTTEKKKAADQITFAFKYRTSYDNFQATNRYSVNASQIPNTITTTNYTNGWEPLLDYHDRPINIFGRQLSNAEQANDPIYVVSNGYEYTRAGYYATTWTAYYNNNGTYTKIGTILPSALIVSSKDRMINNTLYPDGVSLGSDYPTMMQYDDANTQTVYDALKSGYADRPVMITYEKAILNSNTSGTGKYYHAKLGELSIRSDGRWFYSYMNEEINANLRIDYTNEYLGEEDTEWTSDTYRSGTNTGSVTGATVHFTNDGTTPATDGGYNLTDYHDTADWTALDPTNNIIYSNFNHYYKFAATEGSGYIFQGWYMERDGISTAVNPDDIKDLAGQSQMTSSATFVARYVKNPAGHITINHLMADGSTGTGTTYIGIEKSTDGRTWTHVTGTADDAIFEQVDSFSINNTDIMSYGSGYTLRVTLKTVVESDTNFDRFSASEAEGDHSSEYFSTNVSTESTTSTTQFEIPVDDLFTLNAETGIPAQKAGYDTFTYYSHTTRKPELIINHSKDPNSHAKANGNFFVKVDVTDSGKSQVYHTFDNGNGGYVQDKDIVIPSTYFNTTDNYYLKVYLKTDMLGFTQFEKFSVLGTDLANAQGAQGQEITITDANNKRTKEAVIIFPVSILFNNGVPTTTELPYLSKLIMPDYKYEFKYTVPSYLDKNDSITYTAKDSFAEQDLNDYMTLTNGDLAFQDDNKKKTFICSKAPYEDNFQKTIDFYQQFDTNNRQYNAGQYTLGYEVTIAEAIQETLDVRVSFPYETQSGTRRFEYLATDGIVKAADNHEELITGVYGRDWITTNGVRNKNVAGTPEFIKAPLIIYDGSTPKYFQYWSVETVATDGNASREYTRCYDYEFNLSIYQDCTITPVYNNEDFATRGMAAPVPNNYGTNPQSSGYDRFDPDVNRDRYSIAANGVSISFVENSRNQYNNGGAPSSYDSDLNKTNYTGAADRVYSDFLLTYDIDPKDQLNEHSANTMQAGLIIQPVAYLEKDSNGNYKVDSDTYYGQTTKYTSRAKTSAQIKDYLEGKTSINGLLRSKFDIKELDNKNRVQYFYGFDNAAPKTNDNSLADDDGIIRVGDTYRNKTIVYLAFAYIGEGTADADTLTNVTVSAQPVYFTYYADASIEPGYYIPSTPGN